MLESDIIKPFSSPWPSPVVMIPKIAQKKDIRGKLSRWILQLQEFDFIIEHKKCTENRVADALLRQPVAEEEPLPNDERPFQPASRNFLKTQKFVTFVSTPKKSWHSGNKSLEATVLHRRTLLDADTPSREQPSRPLPIMHPAWGPSIGDGTSSDTSPEPQPATEELLSKEDRNEICECLADGSMYSVMWERFDAVYDRTEVMDQTYLYDLLQIFPLKTQDAASLKSYHPNGHRSEADNIPEGEVELLRS
ncbi:hypothetical protein OUZ56_003330 [Daphnia magna]|uniref:Reverse transcriptase RNase H-like domain-containing protein n=1 Tax=Daphnia magna TaxID=35525 RepID=A0ABR0A8Q5_9CRUS|nr:hypothetical protein OUZ56_003330 [Daphnia magna]